MQMDELENFKPQKQLSHTMSLDSNVSTQQNTWIVYSNIDGPVYKVERSNYATDNGYDLKSGIRVTELEATFAKKLFGRIGFGRLILIQSPLF